MKVCVIGKGASGWMAASYISRNLPFIKEVTLIGSPEIKTIGVGESNTLMLNDFHDSIGITVSDFVRHSDAAVKYGVYYKNWGGHDFLHNFKNEQQAESLNRLYYYYKSLTNKEDNISICDLITPDLHKFILDNKVSVDSTYYPKSWHFDAAKYISYLETFNHKNNKIKVYEDTVVDCKFKDEEYLKKLILKSGLEIESDFFIFASGSSNLLQNLLNEKYHDLSNELLTNRAIVYPLKYSDKKSQFHPYTVAKTMECGWRWITPTYSRIGTGYVYSTNHISDDQAVDEFLNDIGDKTINPITVNFNPRYNVKTFKQNYCTIGMANGFLEPLDAPGITITIQSIFLVSDLLEDIKNKGILSDEVKFTISHSNYFMENTYKKWSSFILHQYKTSSSRNNKFWSDHRNVKSKFYDHMIYLMENGDVEDSNQEYAIMMYHTMSAKNKHWKSTTTYTPTPQKLPQQKLISHLEYIDSLRKNNQSNKVFIL